MTCKIAPAVKNAPLLRSPDLAAGVIMGAHGHGGLKDLIFGTTINPVRHNLQVPILIVRPSKG
jgi:hypothetical protein